MSAQLSIQIDRSSPVPLYHQLAEQLTAAIDSQVLKPGDALENELSLAERLNLSRPTVRRAIAELVERGQLARRRGIGTTVASPVVHRRDELTSLHEDLQRAGRDPRTDVLTLDTAARDPEVAGILSVDPDTPLVYIERLRYAGEEPLAILHNWLPPTFADITEDRLKGEGLYQILRNRGVRPAVAQQTIGARSARATERRLLGIPKTLPVLTMTRRAYDADGRPVEYGDHCYRADSYAFDITVHERH
jgi:GntR family transcriptional regulator